MIPHFYLILIVLFVAVVSIILLSRYLNVHAFFCLLIAALILGIFTGKNMTDLVSVMQTGFGALLQHIGFVVALGSCLGIVLEKTGAMESISERLVFFFGEKKSPLAITTIGLLVGIPVFCDSGFIILSRLIPSIAASASVPSATLSLSLASALYTTHTLVPPTPGPLAAAANLGLSDHLGQVILIGILVSVPVGFVAMYCAKRIGAQIIASTTASEERHKFTVSPSKAILPLAVPILLIGLATLPKALGIGGFIGTFVETIGQPVFALSIGLAMGFMLVNSSQKPKISGWISEALKDAGVILLIVGAGGAFGNVIKSTGIDQELKNYITDNGARGITFMVFGYVIAAILKSAQGSTTSSMIVTSSLLAPLLSSAGFTDPAHLCFLVVAVGGGAMTVSHANDAYFWVISQFGGIQTRDMFRSHTLITLVQGLTTLLISILLYLVW